MDTKNEWYSYDVNYCGSVIRKYIGKYCDRDSTVEAGIKALHIDIANRSLEVFPPEGLEVRVAKFVRGFRALQFKPIDILDDVKDLLVSQLSYVYDGGAELEIHRADELDYTADDIVLNAELIALVEKKWRVQNPVIVSWDTVYTVNLDEFKAFRCLA